MILFCMNKLLCLQKSARFTINCQNMNFSWGQYFLSAGYFFKSEISCFFKNWKNLHFFTIKCQNINFPWGWYFLNVWLFNINTLLFCWKPQNSWLTVKIWTFLEVHILNPPFFSPHKYAIILPKLEKIH